MDIQKAFEEFAEDLEKEARTYIDRKYEKKKKGITPMSQKKKRWGSGGYGKGEETEIDEGVTGPTRMDVQKAFDNSGRGLSRSSPKPLWRERIKQVEKYFKIRDLKVDAKGKVLSYKEEVEIDEVVMVRTQKVKDGFKWLVQKVEHNKTEILDSGVESSRAKADKAGKAARSKIKEETNSKENTMKLVDTVKQVLDEHCGVCGEQGIEEDSDPEEKGTQGDDKEYQAKRAKVLKKYGVASCAFIKDEKTKKQCFQDLDDAHVADHEEGYSYNPHPPEGKPTAKKHKAHKSDASPDVGKISEAFWKVNIPDMPPIFVEASSASEIKKDMRTKLRPDVVKELAIERVSKSEMIKKYREMAKGGGDDEEEVKEEGGHGKTMHDKLIKASQKVADDYNKGSKPKTEVKATGTGAKMPGHCESTDSKLYSSVKKMMKEEDLDDMKDDLRDLQSKLRDKASYRNSQVGWKEDEYEALEKRIDKKRAAIKDAESRTRVVDKHGSTLTRA